MAKIVTIKLQVWCRGYIENEKGKKKFRKGYFPLGRGDQIHSKEDGLGEKLRLHKRVTEKERI